MRKCGRLLPLPRPVRSWSKKDGQLDFKLEQNGRNLSGGQRQRLTIARALVKKPEILILDDSASALDFATDAALRKSLHQLGGNTTTFLVSQRAASIRQADLILVLDDGQLAGKGTTRSWFPPVKLTVRSFSHSSRKNGSNMKKTAGRSPGMSKTGKKSQNKNSMATFLKVLRFIGKYRFLLVLSVILAAVTVILQLYVPVLFGYAIDEVVAAHEVDFSRMGFYLSRILVMIILSGIATWIMSIINNRMTYRTVQDIRAKSIRHIQKLPLSYLDGHSTGDIISRVIADTDILSDGMLLGFTQLFSGIITIIGTLIFMFSKNVWITLMVIVLTPVSFFVAKFISSHSFQMFRAQSDARGRQTALIEEMIGNQKVVQAFGYENRSSERFASINEELRNASQKAVFYSSVMTDRK